MNKTKLSIAAISIMTVALLGAGVSYQTAQAQAALVFDVDNSTCDIFDGDGNSVIVSGDLHVVITFGPNGNQNITCMADVPNNSGSAVIYDSDNNPIGAGHECIALFGSTTNWQQTISASGKTMTTCHYQN